ncbi:hypothetical protein [Lacinutrix jangbogonensis]|uniref:hypothetical protein n=1 Tax=Lacinutrix jangbogonensis TaxID=1469557 RepID=UPI00053D8925|nr:hypothetical protein [Lacinutrix jangbogonensis]
MGIGVFLFFLLILNSYKPSNSISYQDEADKTVTLYTDSLAVSFSKYYLSHQTWQDFNREKHSLPFKVNYNDVIKSNENRNTFRIIHQFYWKIFYKYLIVNDKPLVEELVFTFFNYQKEKNMNRIGFAELIISSIQDIPYNLI